MTVPINAPAIDTELPRPKDVGVLAMEVYFPRRVCCLYMH
jgi:hydroxymethylglutaryl-CoA synthase